MCIVEQVFGVLVGEFFVSFDDKFLVVVLVVQIYLVCMYDGCDVVVKIICFGIYVQVQVDLLFLWCMMCVVQWIWLLLKCYWLFELVDELGVFLCDEIDMCYEVQNMWCMVKVLDVLFGIIQLYVVELYVICNVFVQD